MNKSRLNEEGAGVFFVEEDVLNEKISFVFVVHVKAAKGHRSSGVGEEYKYKFHRFEVYISSSIEVDEVDTYKEIAYLTERTKSYFIKYKQSFIDMSPDESWYDRSIPNDVAIGNFFTKEEIEKYTLSLRTYNVRTTEPFSDHGKYFSEYEISNKCLLVEPKDYIKKNVLKNPRLVVKKGVL